MKSGDSDDMIPGRGPSEMEGRGLEGVLGGEPHQFLAAIVESSQDAIIGKDREGVIRSWNEGAERMYGYAAYEVIGRPISILVPPEIPDDVPRIMERLERGEQVVRYETIRMTRSGDRLDVSLTVSPMRDEEGRLVGASAIARDVTRRLRAEAFDRLLARAGEALSATLHRDGILRRLVSLMVDSVADYCIVYRIHEGHPEVAGAAHANPDRDALLRELSALHPPDHPDHPVRRATESGEVDLVADVDPETMEQRARGPAHLDRIRALGTRSTVVVPLRTRGHPVGAVEAGTVAEGRRPFRREDLPRLTELADLAALAVDNAQLLESRRQKVEELQRTSRELAATVEELSRSREELRTSQERTRLALESARLGTWEWDIPTGRVEWSESLERIHGLEPGTFPGSFEAFQRDIHPDDRDRVGRAIREAVDGGGTDYGVEYRIVVPDGEVRWLNARGRLLRDDGEPRRMVGVCLDVTERRRAETHDRFLADVSPILSSSLDPDAALTNLAEVVVPEIADWCAVDLLDGGEIRRVAVAHPDPESRKFIADRAKEAPPHLDESVGSGAVIRTGEPLFLEEVPASLLREVARDEDDLREVEALGLRSVIAVPLEARGARFGCLTLAQSTSGRRFDEKDLELARELVRRTSLAVDNARLHQRSEDTARRLELERARLAHLFDHAPASIAVLSGPDHVIELANPRYREFVGERELIGRPIREALPELVEQEHVELLDRVYRTGEAHRAQGERVKLRRREDGPLEDVFFNYLYAPLHEPDGSVRGVFVHGVDVTELVRSRESAERAVQTRDEMLAFVSHDLRQPIGVLQTATQALLELPLPEDQRSRMLERALRASQQADRLIDDLMDLARSDVGRLELEKQVAPVAPMVASVLDLFSEEAGDRDLELRVDVPDDLPPLQADPDRIHRVLSNLVANAIKHTPEGGTVSVVARREPDEGAVIFQVADTGKGIPEEEQPHVFDRYWQGRDRSRMGLGLGLSIVRDIVEAHGGRIWVESEVGRGCTFHLLLPTSEGPGPA